MTFQVVDKILGNDFDVKSCECAPLQSSSLIFTGKERVFLSVGASMPEVPGPGKSIRRSFWDKT
jgi:hypothetical protein